MAKRDLEQEKRHQAREDHRRAIGERKTAPKFAKKGYTAVEEGRLMNGLPVDQPLPTVADRLAEQAQASLVEPQTVTAEGDGSTLDNS